jgi:MFS family permease
VPKTPKTASQKPYEIKKLIVPVYLPSLLFSTGEAGLIPIIPASAQALGADLPTAGLIAGLVMIGTLIADLPAARLVDYLGERRSMIAAAATASLGILFSVFATNIFMLGFGILIIGMTAAVFALARHSYIAEHVPFSHRARSLAILGGMFRGGNFLGPLIGAGIITIFGIQSIYWLAVVFCGLAGLILLATKPESMLNTPSHAKGGTWRVAKAEKSKLLTIGLASAILGAVRTTRIIGLPLWALYIGLDPALAALYIGLAGALDFALFYTSGQVMDKFGRRFAAVPTLIGMGLTHMLVGFAVDGSLFLAVALLMSLANGVGSGVILVLGADLAPPAARNEFLASYRLVIDAGVAASAPVLSGLTILVGLGAGMSVMGGLALGGAWLMWHYLPKFGIK